ncbi:DUF1351 domain-containing protein [Enterococcus casseliflavus]|nr:DUF1351 domain-containing protein [Enterococcus casseliflavus]
MNELIKSDTKIQIDFKPSAIEIKNEAELTELVNNTVKHYKSLVFSEGDIEGAKQAQKSLTDKIKLLETKRKEIKSQYSEPLEAFEKKIKGYVNQMGEAKEGISESLKQFESTERDARFEKVKMKLNELCAIVGVDPKDIQIPDKWTNKGAFTTTKGELKKAIIDEITGTINEIVEERQQAAVNKRIVEGYAKAAHLDSVSWMILLDQGLSVDDIMSKIDQVVAGQKARLAKAEEVVQVVRQKERVPSMPIDQETSEIQEIPIEEKETSSTEKVVTLKLKGTDDQFFLLNKTIVKLGIEVVNVSE